ncbi:MAG TPA: NAD(P)/FAD-dependent oxidoreductase [Gaiellaceae bacterium]|nr:NAD(P)/FAD-dependent oxidoreductase [Gaiellaceae bacterium]
MKRVVIVGGGFGGLIAARGLKRADVELTLVDRQNFFLFQPLVYQVATGSLSSVEVAFPLRRAVRRQRNTHVVLGEATAVDVDARVLTVSDLPTGGTTELSYDVLAVATGSRYSYFGHDGWAAHAPELKTLDGALELRDRILLAFEAAELEHDDAARQSWLTFAVVGAGTTGVEMAGQIAELARDVLPKEYRSADTRRARVLLVEAGDRVLPGYAPALSASAERQLRSLGVTPLLRTTVVGMGTDWVEVERRDGARERIPARTRVWAAGVAATPFAGVLGAAAGAELDRAGRVVVEPDLTVSGHRDVFAFGDMVSVRGQQLHGVAPVAMQQGRHVARSIREGTRTPFHYTDKGELATIGRARAVGTVRGVHVTGFPAWALWLGIHITYLVGFENRVLVLIRWAVAYLTRGRGARIVHRP